MNADIITCSGALVYSLKTERFLFLYRKRSKNQNVWGLVGGTSEQLERPWETLKREIDEEIGHIEIKKTIPLETFVSNDEKFNFHTYLCLVEDEFIPTLNYEHSGYAWTSFGDWPKPLHQGLNNTLKNKNNIQKLDTVFKLINMLE